MDYTKQRKDTVFLIFEKLFLDECLEERFDWLDDGCFHVFTEELLSHFSKIETWGDHATEDEFYKAFQGVVGQYVYISQFGEAIEISEIMELENTDDVNLETFDHLSDLLFTVFRDCYLDYSTFSSSEFINLAILCVLIEKNNIPLSVLDKKIKLAIKNSQ